MIYVLAGSFEEVLEWADLSDRKVGSFCYVRDSSELLGRISGGYVLVGTWYQKPGSFELLSILMSKGLKEVW